MKKNNILFFSIVVIFLLQSCNAQILYLLEDKKIEKNVYVIKDKCIAAQNHGMWFVDFDLVIKNNSDTDMIMDNFRLISKSKNVTNHYKKDSAQTVTLKRNSVSTVRIDGFIIFNDSILFSSAHKRNQLKNHYIILSYDLWNNTTKTSHSMIYEPMKKYYKDRKYEKMKRD